MKEEVIKDVTSDNSIQRLSLVTIAFGMGIDPPNVQNGNSFWCSKKNGALQYCAKVTQTNFDEFLGFSWLFKEISLQTKIP